MIIAFSGSAGVGKSTAFETIRANSKGRAVCLTKFAAPLYSIQEQIYRLISPVYQRPDTFVKDRKLLQWLGTEWGRDTISKTLWVDLWKARTQFVQAKDAELIVVCDDCRFENEAQTVHSLGGVIIKLTSNRSFDIGGISGHASEAGLPSQYVDYEIENNGTVEEFQAAVQATIAKIEADLAIRAAQQPQATEAPVLEEEDFMPECAVQTKPAEQAPAEEPALNDDDFLPTT